MTKYLKIFAGVLAASGLSLAAQAADLPTQPEPVAPVAIVPPFTWTGFYVGAQLGWGQTSTDYTAGAQAPDATDVVRLPTISKNGFMGGLFAGYNYQINQFVLGAEVDGNFLIAGKERYTAATGDAITAHTDWLGSARLRAGYAFDRLLIYATGGLAFASPNSTVTGTGYSYGAGNGTRFGWTLGVGAEYAFTDHWIAGLEYRYTSFSSDTYTYPVNHRSLGIVGFKQQPSVNQVLARLSYKF